MKLLDEAEKIMKKQAAEIRKLTSSNMTKTACDLIAHKISVIIPNEKENANEILLEELKKYDDNAYFQQGSKNKLVAFDGNFFPIITKILPLSDGKVYHQLLIDILEPHRAEKDEHILFEEEKEMQTN
jgi:hypothetical protein